MFIYCRLLCVINVCLLVRPRRIARTHVFVLCIEYFSTIYCIVLHLFQTLFLKLKLIIS